jgi:hypothetical protein
VTNVIGPTPGVGSAGQAELKHRTNAKSGNSANAVGRNQSLFEKVTGSSIISACFDRQMRRALATSAGERSPSCPSCGRLPHYEALTLALHRRINILLEQSELSVYPAAHAALRLPSLIGIY